MERQRVPQPRSAQPYVSRSVEPAERETAPGMEQTHLAPQATRGPASRSQFGHSLAQLRVHTAEGAPVPVVRPVLSSSAPYIARDVAPTSSSSGFPATVFNPGVNHDHRPTGRWAEVQDKSSCFNGKIECICAHNS